MILRPPRSTRTDTLFPYTTLFRSHQRPVDDGDVELPRCGSAGVLDAEPWDEAKLDRLLRHREGTRYHRLAGDDGGQRGDDHQRQAEPVGREPVEGVLDGLRVRSEERRVGKESVSTGRSRWSTYH